MNIYNLPLSQPTDSWCCPGILYKNSSSKSSSSWLMSGPKPPEDMMHRSCCYVLLDFWILNSNSIIFIFLFFLFFWRFVNNFEESLKHKRLLSRNIPQPESQELTLPVTARQGVCACEVCVCYLQETSVGCQSMYCSATCRETWG